VDPQLTSAGWVAVAVTGINTVGYLVGLLIKYYFRVSEVPSRKSDVHLNVKCKLAEIKAAEDAMKIVADAEASTSAALTNKPHAMRTDKPS